MTSTSTSIHSSDGNCYKYHPSCRCSRCESERQKSERYWTTNNLGYVIERTSTHSTNSTASNLPGPGRLLDRGLGIVGRAFEKRLFRKAHKLGFGPKATAIRLQARISKFKRTSNPSDQEKAWKKIVKDSLRLLAYTERCDTLPRFHGDHLTILVHQSTFDDHAMWRDV